MAPQVADVLRVATACSVDKGKTTLIGRLFHHTEALFEEQLDAVPRPAPAAGRRPRPVTHHRRGAGRARAGHRDRRRRPILRHPRRTFIIADSPGTPSTPGT